jgi:hypothetical protein
MKRNSQSGVALVITLVLLAMVTLMAVIFLSMGRRDRASVKVSEDQLTSKLMADAAEARAQAEVIAKMKAANNPLNYQFFVSTNFNNPAGFNTKQQGTYNPTNVSYTYPNGTMLNQQDMLRNLGNLQYDPRPPVFIQTNATGATDFRYYLDFNRNRAFETNGYLPAIASDGTFVKTNGLTTTKLSEARFENFSGDPEWIGMLEHPDLPHGETNRFVGRYAYLVLPAGKSLDLNFIHNQVAPLASARMDGQTANNGYTRNQGYGSWEINLAAFLRELNTNVYAWGPLSYQYNQTFPVLTPPRGVAFDDARQILSYRYDRNRTTLGPAPALGEGRFFQSDLIDNYGDHFGTGLSVANERATTSTNAPWPGNLNTNSYFDAQQIFTLGGFTPEYQAFLNRLQNSMVNKKSSYDRYTYYRMLAQLGVDSVPAVSVTHPKIDLNYTNNLVSLPSGTNMIPWTSVPPNPPTNGLSLLGPNDFFFITADSMLRSSVGLQVFIDQFNRRITNYAIGDTPVRPDISLTNIQVWHQPSTFYPNNTSNEYSASIHRILQVAANIYDNMTNYNPRGRGPYFPSVFSPVFKRTTTNIIICGFTVQTNNAFAGGIVTNINSLVIKPPGDTIYSTNFFGQPAVIGAKKGWPSFNEFSAETFVQVSRRLEVVKKAPGKADISRINQMYMLGISNIFGLEAWNSYRNNYTNALTLTAVHRYNIYLSNNPAFGPRVLITNLSGINTSIISTNFWAGNTNYPKTFGDRATFILPIEKAVLAVDNKAASAANPFLRQPILFETDEKFSIPTWFLTITNSVQYLLVDTASQRVIDFVNLDNLNCVLDITKELNNQGAPTTVTANAIAPAVMWLTNSAQIVGYAPAVTMGITNQMAVAISQMGAKADPAIASQFLQDFSRDPVTGQDYQRAVNFFRVFRGLPEIPEFPRLTLPQIMEAKAELIHQVPFVPVRKIYQRMTWQANDPLVHYMAADLFDPRLATNNVRVISPPQLAAARSALSNLGKLNDRYKPWGASAKDITNDPTALDPAIKDPFVTMSDDWRFPIDSTGTNYFRFPTIGWLGKIHRGTPWQTIYLKGTVADPIKTWTPWSGSLGTHPTNDWRLLDLFTTAPNDNAARGLLSVNQTNTAAWSAVLSGLMVITNTTSDAALKQGAPPTVAPILIQPGTAQISNIVVNINFMRRLRPSGSFTNLGEVLASQALTDFSPYLNTSAIQKGRAITEDMLEQIPTQILSLLKVDEPRVVIYAFGQSLKPAPRSLSTSAAYYNMCTNYQVTGEVVTKTVLRVEGMPLDPAQPLRTVVESFNVLPPIE